MLETLPLEILHIIMHELVIMPHFQKMQYIPINKEFSPRKRSFHGSRRLLKDEKYYTSFKTWTEIRRPHDLLSLAHSCRALQAKVYPFIARSVVYYNDENSMDGALADLQELLPLGRFTTV